MTAMVSSCQGRVHSKPSGFRSDIGTPKTSWKKLGRGTKYACGVTMVVTVGLQLAHRLQLLLLLWKLVVLLLE